MSNIYIAMLNRSIYDTSTQPVNGEFRSPAMYFILKQVFSGCAFFRMNDLFIQMSIRNNSQNGIQTA